MNAIYIYRVAHVLYKKKLNFLAKFFVWLNYALFNSYIPSSCLIGKGSKFAYGGIGVVIHSKAVIGQRVLIGQGITIGRKLSPNGVPIIGDDVYISAGSRILGDIKIGSNVIIGANSVVIHDIPDNTIVAGAPAKVVKHVEHNIYDLLENIY